MNRKPDSELENESPLSYLMKGMHAENMIKDIPPHKFGTLVIAKVQQIGKLGNRGMEAAYLGLSHLILGGYSIWIPNTNKLNKFKAGDSLMACGRFSDSADIIFMNDMFMDWFIENYKYTDKVNYDDFNSVLGKINIDDISNVDGSTDLVEFKPEEKRKNSGQH